MFTEARKRLKSAAKFLDVDREVLEKLKYPKETLAATLAVRIAGAIQSHGTKAFFAS
ncbi:MAG: hypothetical protein V3S95_09545 [Alphaproteobacteria bacterium]